MRDLQEHRNIDSMPIVKTMTLATFRPLTGGSVGDECNGENDKGENGLNLSIMLGTSVVPSAQLLNQMKMASQ